MKTLHIVPILLLAACHAPRPSLLKGHTENNLSREANEEILKAYQGKLRVPAEYEPTAGVMIGRSDLPGLDEAILKTGVELWLTSRAEDYPENLEEVFPNFQGMGEEPYARIRFSGIEVERGWIRDFGPLNAVDDKGQLTLLDFNYAGGKADRERTMDEAAPSLFADYTKLPRLSIPMYLDGGNFIINRLGHCMLAESLYTRNVNEDWEAEELPDDFEVSRSEIDGYLRDYVGCQKISVFPVMPVEPTGHIDLWAKFLNDNTVVVHELREEVLSLGTEDEREQNIEIKKFLDERAREIEALGYTVVRWPMLLPEHGEFRNYMNTLLVNQFAIVPVYDNRRSPDSALYSQYEEEIRLSLSSFGLTMLPVNSEATVSLAGSVHCQTMQIPKTAVGSRRP